MVGRIQRFIALQSSGVVLAALALGTSGCAVALKHDALNAPGHSYNDPLATARLGKGIDGKVGWGRFTVFAIPIVPIYISGAKDGNEQVADQVRDALRQVGYNVTVVDALTSTTGPVLKCQVNKFWFSNYTWLFPIVPTWGSIDLTVSVEAPGSTTTLWTRGFSGSGSSLNFFDGYSSAANEALTKILKEMVTEFSSEQFHTAVTHT